MRRRAGIAPGPALAPGSALALALALGLGLALAACAPTSPDDAQVPPYARRPYAAFSRRAAVAIARREWRAFGERVVEPDTDLPGDDERAPGLWQRVGDYWWMGLPLGAPDQGYTGKHDAAGRVFPASEDGRYAWSAAFIDYVMRMAGAGHRFPYAADHAHYINAAREEALGRRHDLAITARRPSRYAPLPGDLICLWRGRHRVRYDDLPAGIFPSHCDIVVATHPGMLDVIGGNVDNTVALRHIPVTADGRLAWPDGTLVDPNNPWFVVIRVAYAVND